MYGNSTNTQKNCIQKLHAQMTHSEIMSQVLFFVIMSFASDIIKVMLIFYTLNVFSSTNQRIKFGTCWLWLLEEKVNSKKKVYCVCDFRNAVWSFDVYLLQKQLYWRFWTDLYCMNYWFPSTQYRLCYRFSWNRFRRWKGESLLNFFCCIT